MTAESLSMHTQYLNESNHSNELRTLELSSCSHSTKNISQDKNRTECLSRKSCNYLIKINQSTANQHLNKEVGVFCRIYRRLIVVLKNSYHHWDVVPIELSDDISHMPGSSLGQFLQPPFLLCYSLFLLSFHCHASLTFLGSCQTSFQQGLTIIKKAFPAAFAINQKSSLYNTDIIPQCEWWSERSWTVNSLVFALKQRDTVINEQRPNSVDVFGVSIHTQLTSVQLSPSVT